MQYKFLAYSQLKKNFCLQSPESNFNYMDPIGENDAKSYFI